MEFEKYFSAKTVIPNLKAQSKQEVISSLVEIVEKEHKIPKEANLLSYVIQRESVDSTGVGNGIAIPHAVVREINKVVTAIARIPEGIDFVAQDRKPVFLAIMICYPPSQDAVYLSLISSISKLFIKRENLQTIIKQTTAKSICDTFIDLLKKQDEHTETIAEKKKSVSHEEKVISTPIPEIHLLIRLQMLEEEMKSATRGKKQIQNRIDNVRSLLSEKTLQYYNKLKSKRPPAVVSIEGDRCRGCHMALHTDFVQRVKQDTDKLYICPNCSRFVYWI